MINQFGDNLHVVILTQLGFDWKSYSTWYSVNKNLPHAKCSIVYTYNDSISSFHIFQWAKRLKIPTYGFYDRFDNFTNILVSLLKSTKNENVLFLYPHHMVLKPLDQKTIDVFNQKENKLIWDERSSGGFTNLNRSELIDQLNKYMLEGKLDVCEDILIEKAKESDELKSLVCYQDGCGNWNANFQGCPFSNVSHLLNNTMTVNEQKIFDLWKKMAILYQSIN